MESSEYRVSDKQKQLWNIELQLSDVLLDICKKSNLKIWACYGTLLGAVRHNGFIPWDDDMDFVMMREDYDKLLSLINSSKLLLPDNCEFDTTNIRAIKLRRKDTTMKPVNWRYSNDISYGVWVDIFSLDVAPDTLSTEIKKYEWLKKKIRIYLSGRLSHYNSANIFRYKLSHFYCRLTMMIRNANKYKMQIEDTLKLFGKQYSGNKVWAFMVWSTLVELKKVRIYDKSWFDETVMLPFEDRVLPCPKCWEEILTVQYGDWRTPVMGESQHEGSYVNINKPYSDYIKETLKQMPWWKRYWYKH